MSAIIENLTEILTVVFIGLLTAAAAFFSAYLNNLRDKLKAEKEAISANAKDNAARVKTELASAAFDAAERLAETVVNSLEQTMAKDLRQKVKNGIVSEEVLINLGKQAAQTVVSQLSPTYLSVLDSVLYDKGNYIGNLVESKVLAAKAMSQSVKSPAAPKSSRQKCDIKSE